MIRKKIAADLRVQQLFNFSGKIFILKMTQANFWKR